MGTSQSTNSFNLTTLNEDSLSIMARSSENLNDDEKLLSSFLLNKHGLNKKVSLDEKREYNILKYNKSKLNKEYPFPDGFIRSVIFKDENMVCFSPPKSVPFNIAKTLEDFSLNKNNVVTEEFVEGTMINMFYDDGRWRIATKSSVGGRVGFFTTGTTRKVRDENTFRSMFFDAVDSLEATTMEDKGLIEKLDDIPKNVCLSFVLQHPKNRIVVPFSKPALYLVAAYFLNDYTVTPINIRDNSFRSKLPSWVSYPEVYNISNYEELNNKITSISSDYKKVGVIIYSETTGLRTKIRNPLYESVKRLRGNQPKLQYRFLTLRKHQKIDEYLHYYPEHRELFNDYNNKVTLFSSKLYSNYIACYVRKHKPLREYSSEYRTNMFKIHEKYINELRPVNLIVTKEVVHNYVNSMEEAILMNNINYKTNKSRVISKSN
jgi:hypothetical protein